MIVKRESIYPCTLTGAEFRALRRFFMLSCDDIAMVTQMEDPRVVAEWEAHDDAPISGAVSTYMLGLAGRYRTLLEILMPCDITAVLALLENEPTDHDPLRWHVAYRVLVAACASRFAAGFDDVPAALRGPEQLALLRRGLGLKVTEIALATQVEYDDWADFEDGVREIPNEAWEVLLQMYAVKRDHVARMAAVMRDNGSPLLAAGFMIVPSLNMNELGLDARYGTNLQALHSRTIGTVEILIHYFGLVRLRCVEAPAPEQSSADKIVVRTLDVDMRTVH